ncbi:uncharacterized protein LOC105914882 [Setaria italica]|uniref:uncharacterized protein LOC105914882 n=1 Tax=Setaria italica TaxID=4555 RepID=UPI0006490FD1|nr:uncharacterized protein LOC105914882 [Setaria italica]
MASPATSSDSSAPFASTVPAAPQPAPTSVVQTVNIRSHVPVLLDMVELNYTQWWCIFDFVLGKFGLDNHIHSPPALAQRDGDLVMNNHSVVNWIYTTMNKAVFNTVYKPHASAFTIWTDVEGLFRDNEMQRAIYLEAEFRKIHQDFTDALRDVDQPVSEPSQVLNLLRGLNPKYRHLKPIIADKFLLHTFMSACLYLLMEELRDEHDAKKDDG